MPGVILSVQNGLALSHHYKGHLMALLTLFLEASLASLPPLPLLARLFLSLCSGLHMTLLWLIRTQRLPSSRDWLQSKDITGLGQ